MEEQDQRKPRKRGRPPLDLDADEVQRQLAGGTSIAAMSRQLGVSRRTIARRRDQAHGATEKTTATKPVTVELPEAASVSRAATAVEQGARAGDDPTTLSVPCTNVTIGGPVGG